ncbi:MAG: hypothetical protein WCL06_08625, partial [Bacteroidota bacterium]
MGTKRFKPIYLLLLALPVFYYFLQKSSSTPTPVKTRDYLYFSALTTHPATISLFAGKDSLASWQINAKGYKYLDYGGTLNDKEGLTLKVSQLGPNDSLCFLAVNLFRDNRVYSLVEHNKVRCLSSNATFIEKEGALDVAVQSAGKPVEIWLPPSTEWDTSHAGRNILIILSISFLLTFVFIVLLSPPVRYFIFSCILALLLMVLFFWQGRHYQSHVTLTINSQAKSFQTYFNNEPCFVAGKMHSSNILANSFTTEVDLAADKFIRFDMDGSPVELGNATYSNHLGLFHCKNNLSSVAPSALMLNDLSIRNGKYYITGDDPYFTFTSSYFVSQADWLIHLQKRLYLFIGLLILILLTGLHYWLSRIPEKHFHPAYIVFLILPALYYLLSPNALISVAKDQKDLLYFSIRTSHPSLVELKDAGTTLASWQANTAGYKYLQYGANNINNASGLSLNIKNLNRCDTISLLSINVYHNKQVFSFFKENALQCRVSNANIISKKGAIDAVVQSPNIPVSISFPSYYTWHTTDPANHLRIYIIMAFIGVFLLIILIAPPIKRFLIAVGIGLIIMMSVYWITRRMYYQVAMQTSCPVRNPEF